MRLCDRSRRDFEEVWHQGELDAISDIYAPSYRGHGYPLPGAVTRDRYRWLASLFLSAFPDIRFDYDLVRVGADVVRAEWEFTGTHTGRVFGVPPSGEAVSVEGVGVHHYEDGQVIETWLDVDWTGLLKQFGRGYL